MQVLKKLYEKEKGRLVILGFPANDFKHQETTTTQPLKNSAKEITILLSRSCKKQGDRTFYTNPVFEWLKMRNATVGTRMRPPGIL